VTKSPPPTLYAIASLDRIPISVDAQAKVCERYVQDIHVDVAPIAVDSVTKQSKYLLVLTFVQIGTNSLVHLVISPTRRLRVDSLQEDTLLSRKKLKRW
jgi:hypothetical protein